MANKRAVGDTSGFLLDPRAPSKEETARKEKEGRKPVEKKLCMKCEKVFTLDKFYPNALWTEQKNRDSWCKECVNVHCKNETALKEYAYYNNRRYSPSYFEDAKLKALYYLNSDKEYINPRTNKKRKEEMLDAAACKQFFSLMNLKPYYSFFENVRNDLPLPKFTEGSADGTVVPAPTESDDDVLVYSKAWFGYYTKNDIKYLDTYFQEMKETFDLTDPSRIDYARKMCRASLEADKAFNAYRDGTGQRVDWEKSLTVYDMLNKSAAFAASTKKKDIVAVESLTSLAEIILAIEETGELLPISPNYFPEDNIDIVYKQFKHIVKAIKGGE